MKKTCILLVLVTIAVLGFFVVFPYNLGARTPIWEIKERFFGDQYGTLRSEYFISMNKQKMWDDNLSEYFFIYSDHDIFRITEVYLKITNKIAKNCKIKSSGLIEWK